MTSRSSAPALPDVCWRRGLSEHPENRVLLIEAGKDYTPGQEPPEILDIFAATAYSNPDFIWPNLTARFSPRPGNAPDIRPHRRYNQGRVIGGTSSINGMASLRGLPSDYEHWAAAGARGWDWQGVLPYFKKLETDTDFDGPLHGKSGPIRLQRYGAESWPGFARGVIEAIEKRGWSDRKDQNADFADGYASDRLLPHRYQANGRRLVLSDERSAAAAQSCDHGGDRRRADPVRRRARGRRSRPTGRADDRTARARGDRVAPARCSRRRCCCDRASGRRRSLRRWISRSSPTGRASASI